MYQNQQHANGSLAFVLEIPMSKMSPVLVSQLPRNVMKFSEKIEQDRHISSHDTAYEFNMHHETILNHFQKAGFKKKLVVWVPHELSVKNKVDWLNIYDTLLKRNEIEPFFKRIITGDEKWVKDENIVRKRSRKKRDKRSQRTSKPELTANKVLMCVW